MPEASGKRFSPSFSGCACFACSSMTTASLYKPASAFVDTVSLFFGRRGHFVRFTGFAERFLRHDRPVQKATRSAEQ